jgi:DNA polymerase
MPNSLLRQPYPPRLEGSEERKGALELINSGEVKGCKLCRELAAYRTQTVFGVGSERPRVVFFGEAPGADEDKKGEPFVGRAGQLLTKIIEACTWKREEVYIMNTLKCRPPDNRTPLPDEIANCRSYWERQLEILQPEYIVCLGAVAAQTLMESVESIGRMRGKFFSYRGSKVVATYHPSYLLRNPDAKKFVWDDMQMLLKDMGVELPKKA